MYYVGLDVHQRSTRVEILDCNGKLVKRGAGRLRPLHTARGSYGPADPRQGQANL